MREPQQIDICNGMAVAQSPTLKKIAIGVPANIYWLYVNRDEARELLPILQRFVETGSIEEPPNLSQSQQKRIACQRGISVDERNQELNQPPKESEDAK